MNPYTSIAILLSLVGVCAMFFAAIITVLDVSKLQKLEEEIRNNLNINNAQEYEDLQHLTSQLNQLRSQILKSDSSGEKRLMYENEALIREVREKIEFHVDVKPDMKKKLGELLRQESDLGKISYMIKILKLLLVKP